MFDHIGIVVKDLKRSANLYAHMLAPLGLRIVEKHRTRPGKVGLSLQMASPARHSLSSVLVGPVSGVIKQAPAQALSIYVFGRRRKRPSIIFTARVWRAAPGTTVHPAFAERRFIARFCSITMATMSRRVVTSNNSFHRSRYPDVYAGRAARSTRI